MYITINNTHYPCTGYAPRGDTVTFSGVEGLELPVRGTVTLYADDGFELTMQDAGAYLRQIYEGGTLTLTNKPEPIPEPMPEPLEPQMDDITALQLAVAELAETQAADQTANELALVELAEMMGG